MPKFSEQFIQQVAQATDIVDLVSQHVALKKAGREFVGLCPFHEDHKPSMFVVPAKQLFKCFACGAGGGVYQFVMLHEKLAFPEAVKALAERAHIQLPREYEAPAAPGFAKDDLHAIMKWAGEFFHRQLFAPGGAEALAYAKRRGLTDESIERFNLGYAPSFWDAMLREAGRDGIGEQQLLTCGLIIRRENSPGCYDRFRNRFMFPILDTNSRVIAFGGRALAADERAKYLNSPDTPLFDKSSQLYALNWSRDGIAKSDQAVVVEGYMDAIMPLQGGLTNVVATLGTALTERHVKLLGRFAREIVLLFDSDVAGQTAAQRGLEMFLTQQLHVRVASVPEGKDPCDYVVAKGGEALKEVIAAAPDALEYVWKRRLAEFQAAGGDLAERRKVIDEFLRLVVTSSVYGGIDDLRRGQLAQHIGHILNLPAADLQQEMRRLARAIPRSSGALAGAAAAARAKAWTPGEPEAVAQRQVMEVLLNRPDLFESVVERIAPADFADESLRRLAEAIWRIGMSGRPAGLDELLPLEELADLGGLIADLASMGEKRGNFEATLAGAAEHLDYYRNRRSHDSLRGQATGAATSDDVLREIQRRAAQGDLRKSPKIQ